MACERAGKDVWKQLERGYCRKESKLCPQSRVFHMLRITHRGVNETKRFSVG